MPVEGPRWGGSRYRCTIYPTFPTPMSYTSHVKVKAPTRPAPAGPLKQAGCVTAD